MRIFLKWKVFFTLLFAVIPLSFPFLADAQFELENKANSPAKEAYLNRYSDLFLKAEGEVVRIMKDDTKGTPHQRFIIMTSEGQTILIVHNLHLAPRVPVELGLKVGVYGEYEWNPKGGLIHKTHLSTDKRVPHGWIEMIHTGERYQ